MPTLAEALAALNVTEGEVLSSHVYEDRVVLIVYPGNKVTYTSPTVAPVVVNPPLDPLPMEPLPFDEPPMAENAPETSADPPPPAPESIVAPKQVRSRRKEK